MSSTGRSDLPSLSILYLCILFSRNAEEEGLASGRDFKITAGAVATAPLSGLRFLSGGTGLVTTSRGQRGFQLWSVRAGEDQLHLEPSGPQAPSKLLPNGFCVSDSQVYLTGEAVHSFIVQSTSPTS